MNRLFSAKSVLVAAVALGAVAAASAAHARSDVFLSIGVPVYSQPRPVYVQPAPVYTPAPVYYGYGQPAYVVDTRGPYGDADRDGVINLYDRDYGRNWGRSHRYGPYGDADRDGVPNRYDRAPNNPYRH